MKYVATDTTSGLGRNIAKCLLDAAFAVRTNDRDLVIAAMLLAPKGSPTTFRAVAKQFRTVHFADAYAAAPAVRELAAIEGRRADQHHRLTAPPPPPITDFQHRQWCVGRLEA